MLINRLLLYSLRMLVIVAVGGILWCVGLILFTGMIPSAPRDTVKETDGIAIFTGGKTRLNVALELFQQKKSSYLLISGVNPESTLSEIAGELANNPGITLGYAALDTYGNAEETAEWVRCNQEVKFKDLLATARDLGAQALVTGHYVQRLMGGAKAELHQAIDPVRDQSYFLFATTQDQLNFLRFPLGGNGEDRNARPRPALWAGGRRKTRQPRYLLCSQWILRKCA